MLQPITHPGDTRYFSSYKENDASKIKKPVCTACRDSIMLNVNYYRFHMNSLKSYNV